MEKSNLWNLRTDEDAIVLGVKGHGKSTLLKLIIKNMLKAGRKVFLYDSEKEFGNLKHPCLQVYQPKINTLSRLSAKQKTLTNEKDRIKDEFEPICKAIFEKGNIYFVITSIERYAPVHRELPNFFSLIVNEGRKRGVGILAESRRPGDINKSACANNTNWFMFNTYLPNDVKWLKHFVGDLAEQLKDLPRYHFIRWSLDTNRTERYEPINKNEAEI